MIDRNADTALLKRWGRALSLFLLCLTLSGGVYLATATAAQASTTQAVMTRVAVAPSQQSIETVQIHLGNTSGALVFEPDHLTFVAGKRYKLLLDNPSPTKHYFTAKDFADVVWTQKVQVGLVEVKGAIHELELKPSAVAEWLFIPEKPGTYELHCSIAGHAEAGMLGAITVSTGN